MENFLKLVNNQTVKLSEVPLLSFELLRSSIIENYTSKHLRCIGFLGLDELPDNIRLFIALSDDKNHIIYISSALLKKGSSYKSITKEIHAFHMYERDFYEEFGIMPEGHPWLKPVNYRVNAFNDESKIKDYSFFKMDGESLHEVAVGPIHAGVIEPGHFRFICNGEEVYHLEIQLGYQHRNIEKIFVESSLPFTPHLAESIAGDTVIGHNLAYLNLVESLTRTQIPYKAQLIRAIALELERIAMHLADLSALANDIAYLMGSCVFGVTRTIVINTFLSICGNRFGRGLLRPGGSAYDLNKELIAKIRKNLTKTKNDAKRMGEAMFECPTVTSRFDNTGKVTKEQMIEIGAVGMAARASGVMIDSRVSHPFGAYEKILLAKKSIKKGDVHSRAYIRYEEIFESIDIVFELLKEIEREEPNSVILSAPKSKFSPSSIALSIVEGWRGEIVHFAITDAAGNLIKYKIKDPSFNNWFALALAVRNNGISDFPLCNKSFNLSYCGNDL